MADESLELLENRSPLEAANVPNLDRVAAEGRTGLIRTIPPGWEPVAESAAANLLGLDAPPGGPARGPLEALGIGIPPEKDQLALRFNLVHLFTDYQRIILADHTADIRNDAEGLPFVETLEKDLGDDEFRFVHVGEYRGVMLWKGDGADLKLTPPHAMLGAEVADAMPGGGGGRGEAGRKLHQVYNNAQMLFNIHPRNEERRRSGRTAVNSIWASGAGGPVPVTRAFRERWGVRGGILSRAAVLRGLAVSAGMDVVAPPGVDSSPDDWADAVSDYLRTGDVAYVHCDAGDRAAHRMDAAGKVEAIERFDSLAGAVAERLKTLGDHRLAVLADHRTSPVDAKHAAAPVPVAVCGTGIKADRPGQYDERLLVRGSLRLPDGAGLIPFLMGRG